MRTLALSTLGPLAVSAFATTAQAEPVQPNGSFTASIAGPNSVNTGNITTATTTLTLSGAETVGSFMDSFLGNADNFCGVAGNGCTAAHAPGYLTTGNTVTQTASTFPVGVTGEFADAVTAGSGMRWTPIVRQPEPSSKV